MSDDLAVYEAVANALAEAREPDLSAFDPAAVQVALARVLQHPGPRAEFLAWLDGRVQVLSDGRVSVEERPAEDAGAGAGGGGAGGGGAGGGGAGGGAGGTSVPLPGPAAEQSDEGGLRVRLVVADQPFAEPAVLRADPAAVRFPMRRQG